MSTRTTTIARAVLPAEAQARLDALLRSADEAAGSGDRARATQLLREAALINSFSEQVWQKLLAVVDSPDDRRVCLENLIAINPAQVEYHRMLGVLRTESARIARVTQEMAVLAVQKRKRNRRSFLRGVVLGIAATLFALILGLIVSILVYGIPLLPPG